MKLHVGSSGLIFGTALIYPGRVSWRHYFTAKAAEVDNQAIDVSVVVGDPKYEFDLTKAFDDTDFDHEVWFKKVFSNALQAKTAETLVNVLISELKRVGKEHIRTLEIAGHGIPGVMQWLSNIFADENRESEYYMTTDKARAEVADLLAFAANHPEYIAQAQQHREQLVRLQPLFADNASVQLGACDVAACYSGERLLQEFADLWGVPVTGTTGIILSVASWLKLGVDVTRAPGDTLDSRATILARQIQREVDETTIQTDKRVKRLVNEAMKGDNLDAVIEELEESGHYSTDLEALIDEVEANGGYQWEF